MTTETLSNKHWKVDHYSDAAWRERLGQQALALFLLFYTGSGSLLLIVRLGLLPENIRSEMDINTFFPAWAGIFLLIPLHEGIHWLVMKYYQIQPQLEIDLKNIAVALESTGYVYTRSSFLATSLAPLFVITFLGLLGIWRYYTSIWGLIFWGWTIIHLSTCAGDIWNSCVVLKYPRESYIVTEKDKARIIYPG